MLRELRWPGGFREETPERLHKRNETEASRNHAHCLPSYAYTSRLTTVAHLPHVPEC
jgi:hypothetical protein